MPETKKETLTEQVIDPRDLVAYQPGSIVSRMLAYTKSGTITVFAFDAGEGLSEHTAPYDAVLQVVDGEALVTIAGTEYSLKTGDLIIMPAHIVTGLTSLKHTSDSGMSAPISPNKFSSPPVSQMPVQSWQSYAHSP
jgi:quercetin dioxygenase-like cupin family protein